MSLKVVQATGLALLFALLLPSITQAAPTSLMAAQSCSASGIELTLAWTNGASPVLQQYVDVSLENNGWIPGSYTLNGPVAAGVNSMKVPGLRPGVPYYVRVNQLLGNGSWEASETLTVTTNSVTANTCTPVAPASVTPPPIDAPAPVTPAANTAPPPATTPPGAAAAGLLEGPDELTEWLRSIGVLDQPNVHTFVRAAVAAFNQPAVAP